MKEFIQTLSEAQNANSDIELLRRSIAVESITGNETPFALFLQAELEKLGLNTGVSDFMEGRKNVWGNKKGKKGFPNLLFVGHTDTVHTNGWRDYWRSDPRADPFGGVDTEGAIWGRGACDLKGGICAAMASLRLLHKAGYQLEGGITFAFVGDEESGEIGTGVSAGVKDFLSRFYEWELTVPDFIIYVEPTCLDIFTAQIGFFIANITIRGKSAYFRLPSFLVTLATMGLFAGIARSLTNLRSIPVINDTFTGIFGSGKLYSIPSLVIWTILAVLIGHIVYRHTRFGAHVLAVGDNARAAQVSGIRVARIRLYALTVCGGLAGLAGLLYAGRLQAAKYTLGESDLMTVIAAVIVGGTSLYGGKGSVIGALLGSLMMGMLNNGLILMGLAVSDQMIVRGIIILVAVAFSLRNFNRV